MPSNLINIRIVLGFFAAIGTLFFLYAFSEPLTVSINFEWNSFSTNSELANQKHYAQHIVYNKYAFPILDDIPIPKTEIKIPIPLSWHLYEIGILLLFLLSFLLHEPFLNSYSKAFPVLDELGMPLSDFLKNKHPIVYFLLASIKNLDRASLFISAFAFFLFAATKLFLHHHGTYKIPDFDKLLLAATTIAMFLSIVPFRPQQALRNSRREFLKYGSVALISAFSPTVMEKLFQSISVGHFSRPRYRTKHLSQWQKISISAGLYRHIKSDSFYYVNDLSFVRSSSKINDTHLVKAHFLDLNYSDFPHISKLTASTFFEDYSLKLMQRGKLQDALQCLEIGCNYETYRIRNHNEQKPNIRLFKLYGGLCHKHKVKHNLSKLRKEICHDKFLSDLLQPPPQRWLMTRAWWFKRRWSTKKQYNKVKLTEI